MGVEVLKLIRKANLEKTLEEFPQDHPESLNAAFIAFSTKFCSCIQVPVPVKLLGSLTTVCLLAAVIFALADYGFSLGSWIFVIGCIVGHRIRNMVVSRRRRIAKEEQTASRAEAALQAKAISSYQGIPINVSFKVSKYKTALCGDTITDTIQFNSPNASVDGITFIANNAADDMVDEANNPILPIVHGSSGSRKD